MRPVQAIRLVGSCQCSQAEFEEALREKSLLNDREIVESNYCDQQITSEVIQTTDLFVCFVDDKPSDNAWFRFLIGLIREYPYVPVVVVGIPLELGLQQQHVFYALRASRYLRGDASAQNIAQATREALESVWWWGISQSEIATVLVDKHGTIIRHNQATKRFVDEVDEAIPLVGKSFHRAIEDGSGELPDEHPINQVMQTSRGVNKYWEYGASEDQPDRPDKRAYYICFPVFGLKNKVQAVAVMLIEMNRWIISLNAANRFQDAENVDDLCEMIVDESLKLGFRRARIYELIANGTRLKGRAASGFADDDEFQANHNGLTRKQYFSTEFEFDLSADPPGDETINRPFPSLCYQGPGQEPDKQVEPDAFWGDRRFVDELDNAHVDRYIEAPILVPKIGSDDKPSYRTWGKLAVDHYQSSHKMDYRDLPDVAYFANVAGQALANLDRRRLVQKHNRLYHDSTKLCKSVLTEEEDHGETLPRTLNVLVSMYLELTSADMAFYRRVDGNFLELEGDPKWREKHSDDFKLRTQVTEDESFSSQILSQRDGQEFQPLIDNYLRGVSLDRLKKKGIEVSPEEERFLSWIGSMVCIPVTSTTNDGEKLRGVIGAASSKPGAFPGELDGEIRKFMRSAGLWVALAELCDQFGWLDRTLQSVISALPRLWKAPSDDVFSAILATLLSAHHGLQWNRVMVFDCTNSPPGTAELVHAIGGVATDEQMRFHRKTLANLANDSELPDIGSFLNAIHAMEIDENALAQKDSLYRHAVKRPRDAGAPIRIYFRSPSSGDTDEADRGSHPLHWLLQQDLRSTSPVNLPLELKPCEWTNNQNSQVDGMFSAFAYVYPLVCRHSEKIEPLGLVVVDMPYFPEKRLEEIKAATNVFLNLVADIIFERKQERELYGWLGTLPAVRHGRGLKEDWEEFSTWLNKLLEKVNPQTLHNQAPELIEMVFDRVNELLGPVQKRLTTHIQAHVAMSKRWDERVPKIEDLGDDLARLVQGYQDVLGASKQDCLTGAEVDCQCSSEEILPLECDPLILNGVLDHLFENACEAWQSWKGGAAPADSPEFLQIKIRASIEESPAQTFDKFIVIEFQDNGRGIPRQIVPYLFVEGFHYRTAGSPDAENRARGRGLGLSRAQLAAYHGDLMLKDDGTGDKFIPANFVIRFGVTHRP